MLSPQTRADGRVDALGVVAARTPLGARRTTVALTSLSNWLQFVRFCLVGLSGYLVNLIVFGACLGLGVHYRGAAVAAFLVAVANNYSWNRLWTFCDSRGDLGGQGLRYLTVSVVALGANVALLELLVSVGAAPLHGQAAAILLVTPLSFVGNKLWSFRITRPAGA
ncbi:MAG: GtrA family protein [Thermoleophilia bacterium]|nr:GtrA family protein [Thermoleophilia bacterium]